MVISQKPIIAAITVLCLALTLEIQGQDQRISPLDVVASRYKDTYLKIVYSQPMKKGRKIFGQLVPYNQVWRTGANEAAELTTTTDIIINGLELKAGTYSLFTIPQENNWTIILNADLGLWGSYNYNPKRDVLRFDIPAEHTAEVTESFTIDIDSNNDKSKILLMWDQTRVTLPVQYPEPKPKQ